MFRICIIISSLLFVIHTPSYSQNNDSTLALADLNYARFKKSEMQGKFDSAFYYLQQNKAIYQGLARWDEYLKTQNHYAFLLAKVRNKNKEALEIAQNALNSCLPRIDEHQYCVAQNYYYQAFIYYLDHQYDQAQNYIRKSNQVYVKIYPERQQAQVYNNTLLGLIQYTQKNYEAALTFFWQSLSQLQKINVKDGDQVAELYSYLGNAFSAMKDYPSAEDAHRKSIEIYKQSKGENYPGLGKAYNNLAAFSTRQGSFRKAHHYYLEALAIYEKNYPPEHPQVGVVYYNLGRLWYKQGLYESSGEYYQKALSIFRKSLGEKHEYIGRILNVLGNVAKKRKDFKKSQTYYEQGLDFRLQYHRQDSMAIARVYHNLGSLAHERKRYSQALAYLQKSISLKAVVKDSLHSSLAIDYLDLGESYRKQKKYDSSIVFFQKALKIQKQAYAQEDYELAYTYNDLATTYYLAQEYSKTIAMAHQAILVNVEGFEAKRSETLPPLKDYIHPQFLLNSLLHKLKAYKKLDQKYASDSENDYLNLAYQHLLLADTLLYQINQRIQTQEDKRLFSRQAYTLTRQGVAICQKLYEKTKHEVFLNQAFHFSERGKAQILRDALTEVEAREYTEIPLDLQAQEEELRSRINFYQRYVALSEDSARQATYRDTLFSLQRRHEAIIQVFERLYPQYHNLKYNPHSSNLSDIQSLLNAKTHLIAYTLGEEASYAFLISQSQTQIIQLPSAQEIERQCIRFYEASQGQKPLASWAKESHATYQAVFAKIAPHLADNQSLIIIPDGLMLRIPLEALLSQAFDKTLQADFKELDYLITKHKIQYHYSASLWHLVQSKTPNFAHSQEFIGFAPFSDGSLAASQRSEVRGQLRSLPESGKEVNGILSMYTKNQEAARALLANSADKPSFIKLASQTRILHLATHSLPDIKNDKLARIAFFGCDNLNTQDASCLLYAGEVYNLKLNNELVVLSSCESGIGQLLKGEGIFSLARSFFYAGSQNIIFSLWDANDLETKKLMLAFYRSLLLEKNNYSLALQRAKKSMATQGIHPRHWSNFLLIGE